jgi:hypothetical protein
VAEDGVAVFEFDPEHGVGEGFGDFAFHGEGVWVLTARPLFGGGGGCGWANGSGGTTVGRFLGHGVLLS